MNGKLALDRLAAMEPAHPADVTLEQLRHGELPADEAQAARTHVEGCARCEARLRSTIADVPGAQAPQLLAGIRRRLDARPSLLARFLRYLTPMIAVAAVAAFFLVRAPEDAVRAKGGPALHVYRLRGTTPVEAMSGDAVKPGEPLSFTIDLDSPGQVFLLGADAAGKLYPVWPPDGGATRAGPAHGLPVPNSVALDSAPGDETFWVVACKADVRAPGCTSRGAGEPPACSAGCTATPFRLKRER